MAMVKEYSINAYGEELVFDNSYIQVTQVFGDKNNIDIQVSIYNNSEKEFLLEQSSFSFTPSISDKSPNFIKQGYEYIKTISLFSGAVDILEEGQIV